MTANNGAISSDWLYCISSMPRPALAPANSPTTAPMIDSTDATPSPANRNGRQLGMMILDSSCHSLALHERDLGQRLKADDVGIPALAEDRPMSEGDAEERAGARADGKSKQRFPYGHAAMIPKAAVVPGRTRKAAHQSLQHLLGSRKNKGRRAEHVAGEPPGRQQHDEDGRRDREVGIAPQHAAGRRT